MRRNIDWSDREQVNAYKKEWTRARRFSTRVPRKLGLDWENREAVRRYKREYYAKTNTRDRWNQIVQKFLGER